MLRNVLYEWFVGVVLDQYGEDNEIRDALEMSIAVHGISLDVLLLEQPETARRLARIIASTAREIADGKRPVIDRPDGQHATHATWRHFGELADLLDGWPKEF